MKQVGLLFLFSVLLFACIGSNETTEESLNYVVTGDVIPDFTIIEEGVKTLSSDDFEGKRSIIFFFNTGCSDCAREFPAVEKAWKILQDDSDFMLATIARGQKKADTDKYWTEKGFTMPKYHDTDKKIFNLFANSYVPRIYILDREKEIVWMGIEDFSELGNNEDAKVSKIIELVKSIP